MSTEPAACAAEGSGSWNMNKMERFSSCTAAGQKHKQVPLVNIDM